MNQAERRLFLIRFLLDENPAYREIGIPSDAAEQRYLLRALLNAREPQPIREEFFQIRTHFMPVSIRGRQSAPRSFKTVRSVSVLTLAIH